MTARDLLDRPGPPADLPADPARTPGPRWPPEIDAAWVNELLDEDARHEAEYLAARAKRLAPLADALGLKPEYVGKRDREALREDAASMRAVRWLLAAGKVTGWVKGYHKFVLKGHFGWVPTSTFQWYRERRKD